MIPYHPAAPPERQKVFQACRKDTSGIRETTGCNVVAVVRSGRFDANPDALQPMPQDAELVVIGDMESENRFFAKFG